MFMYILRVLGCYKLCIYFGLDIILSCIVLYVDVGVFKMFVIFRIFGYG